MDTKNQPTQNSPQPPAQNTAPLPPVAAPSLVPHKANTFADGINLIPELTEKEVKSGVYKKKINIVALVILMVTALIIGVIIVVQIVLSIQANQIQKKTKEAEAKVVANKDIEIKNLATKEKLDKINELLINAIPTSVYNSQVEKIIATSPPIILSSTSIAAGGEALVEGAATTSEVFKQFVANLGSDDAKEHFDKVTLISLSGSLVKGEGYKFSIRLSFTKKGLLTQE